MSHHISIHHTHPQTWNLARTWNMKLGLLRHVGIFSRRSAGKNFYLRCFGPLRPLRLEESATSARRTGRPPTYVHTYVSNLRAHRHRYVSWASAYKALRTCVLPTTYTYVRPLCEHVFTLWAPGILSQHRHEKGLGRKEISICPVSHHVVLYGKKYVSATSAEMGYRTYCQVWNT